MKMQNTLKKASALCLAVILSLGALTSCNLTLNDETESTSVNETVTENTDTTDSLDTSTTEEATSETVTETKTEPEEIVIVGPPSILRFSFNKFDKKKTYSDDGEHTVRFSNHSEVTGYMGAAVRCSRVGETSGIMESGTISTLLEGKSQYTVSFWIMPYQSYHGKDSFRLFSAYGDGKKELISVSYSSPSLQVSLSSNGNDTEADLVFPYKLETAVAPFDAVNTNDGVWQLVILSVDLESNSVKLFLNGSELKPQGSPSIEFSQKTVTGGADAFYSDTFGSDPKGADRNFNGIIDEFNLYDFAFSAEDAVSLYEAYGEPDAPSINDDQLLIDEMLAKLGEGSAFLADSSNGIYGGYVIKADPNDYAIKNLIKDGKFYLTSSLAERMLGAKISGSEATLSGKKITGTKKDAALYFPATELCDAAGKKYIDLSGEIGLFVILADDSTLTAEDQVALNRLAVFCEETEYETKINMEQSRSVITYMHPRTGLYTWSPSITKIGDTLYASCDISCKYTLTFRSTDGGKTWTQMGKVDKMWWATIFTHNGELYLFGRHNAKDGSLYIGVTKSTDGGKTWSEITATQGGISYEGYGIHRAPVPVIEHNGYIYTVFEVKNDKNKAMREVVAYADASKDLLDPKNWKFKDYLSDNRFPNEGSIVHGKDGNLWVVSRETTNTGFLSKLSPDGNALVPYTGSLQTYDIDLPGGQTKMTVRYDKATDKYLAIANIINLEPDCLYQRNCSALIYSDDLINWEIGEILLTDRTVMNPYCSASRHAFQYVDWIFDGDDILLVTREATEDAANFHDSNYITFYRFENYKQYVD